MKRGTRWLAITLPPTIAATVIAASILPSAASTRADAERSTSARVSWSACPDHPDVDCGTLTVPVDWAKPGGQTIDLALARRAATEPDQRIGSAVINPGGPGASGVDAVVEWTDWARNSELNKRFDIVGFDPRGTGRSHPVSCLASLVDRRDSTLEIGSQADFDRAAATNRQLAADCRKRTGAVVDHMDTLSVVRDVDAIRAAVGDEKLTFYGVSYGTMIGQQYAEVFGDRVRAIVVDSNMDHSLDVQGFMRTSTIAMQDSFDGFVAWCDRTDSCPLRARGARTVMADLRARAASGQLPDPDNPGGHLSAATLSANVFKSYLTGPSWPELADYLASLSSATAPQAAGTSAAEVPQTSWTDAPLICADWNFAVKDYQQYAAFAKQAEANSPDLGLSAWAAASTLGCLTWPGRVTNPQHRLRPRGTTPLLVLNALHDPATGYIWADSTVRQAGGRAVLVTYEGWGHVVYNRSACAAALADNYLTHLVIPKPGTRCPAESS